MIGNQSKTQKKNKSVKIDTPQLLKEISKRPILFDSTVKDFKKYNLRTKEWTHLGNMFNIKGSEAKVRWRSVRDGYLRHIRRTELNKTERGNWIYYDDMEFFAPHVGRKRRKNEDPNSDESVSNNFFEFVQSMGTQVSNQEKKQLMDNTNSNSYEMLVESIDQEESTKSDGEFHEVHSPVYLETVEPIDEEGLPYESEDSRLLPGRELSTTAGPYEGDDNEKFLLSCLPALRRLNVRKNMLARLRIQEFLYDIEFNEND